MLASTPQKRETPAGPTRRLIVVSLHFGIDFLVVQVKYS